jgi:Domain of unknown function DUF29
MREDMPPTSNAPAYEDDFVAWLEDQARHARRGEIDALDLENIAEELEGMARSDRREIRNRLTVLLIHLLKYLVQSNRRSRSWIGTIGEQRRRILSIIDDSPSLRSFPQSVLNECYAQARSGCADETGIPEASIPEECPFELKAVLDPRWLPGRVLG